MRWAMSQPVAKSSAKFVLVAMADCVNADGATMVCWPSVRHLADMTGQDIKTVEAGMRRLREQGFIVDTKERRGETGQVIVYRLNTPKTGAVSGPHSGASNTPGIRDPLQTNTPARGC
jgi:pyocin large subunit-like protein